MALLAEDLLSAIKRRAFWHPTNAPFTDAQILAIADEEILGSLFPKVIAAHADYYSAILDQAITASKQQYRLPGAAYGPLKDVSVVDDQGNEFSCSLIDAEELGHGVWASRYYGQFNGGSVSYSFYFQGDFLCLRPVPSQTQNTLRIRYYRQPSKLCLSAITTTVASVTDSTHFTLAANPASWNASTLDVLSKGNAHQTIGDAVVASGISAGAVTLSSGDISQIAAGDYVTLAGTTPVVQLPDFMLTAAIRKIAAACLEAHGDERAGSERAEAQNLIELAIETASPRVEGEPRMITTSNGPYRSGRVGGYGRW